MVKGLDVFRQYFAAYPDHYVLIGGTAATLVMEDAGLDFRATKDLDIVLYLEALTPDFGRVLWQFIEDGKYEIRQTSSGKPRFYRFQKPGDARFPEMLELFSRAPEGLDLSPDAQLTPIPLEDALSSLSAILLDREYYDFVVAGRKTAEDLTWIDVDRLIPLKASAWLDLMKRQADGETIDTKDIRKHRNDVFRLAQLLAPASSIPLPIRVGLELDDFLVQTEAAADIDIKSLGLKNIQLPDIIARIRQAFGRSGGGE